MSKNGMMVILSAPSGAGKDTVFKEISRTILLTGADSGLTIEIILSEFTRFPKPILTKFILPPYSIF